MKENLEEISASSGYPEHFALLAFQQGVIDAPQLRRAIRQWQEQGDRDLEQILLSEQLVSTDEQQKLRYLIAQHTKSCRGRVAAEALVDSSSRQLSSAREQKSSSLSHGFLWRRRKSRSEARTKRRMERDPYDALHASFTDQEPLLPFLLRLMQTPCRRLMQNCHFIYLSTASLVEQFWYWLMANRQIIFATTCGLTFLFAFVFLQFWFSPSGKARRTAVAAKLAAPTSQEAAEEHPGLYEADSPEGAKQSDSPSSDGMRPRLDAAVVPASATRPMPSSVAPPTTTDVAQDLMKEVKRAVQAENYGEAISLVEDALQTNASASNDELQYALAALLLATKQFDRAGELLVQEQVIDLQDSTWNLLLTCWLFYASTESRTQVGVKLRQLADSLPENDRARRVSAWIEARNGADRDAISILSVVPTRDESFFGGALFYSVALHNMGDTNLALEQAKRAERLLGAEWFADEPRPQSLPVTISLNIARRGLGHYKAKLLTQMEASDVAIR